LTAGELQKLLEAARREGFCAYALTALLGLCGLKVAEALSLTWGDIDFAGGALTVRAGGSVRKVPAPKELLSYLAGYKGEPEKRVIPRSYLWAWETVGKLSEKALGKRVTPSALQLCARPSAEGEEKENWTEILKPDKPNIECEEVEVEVYVPTNVRLLPLDKVTEEAASETSLGSERELSPEEKRRIETEAMRVAMEHERKEGRIPEDVSGREHYDILSRDPRTEEVRYIEVKGHAGPSLLAELSEAEYRFALEKAQKKDERESYWLYIVYNIASGKPRLKRIQNPLSKMKVETVKVTKYILKPTIDLLLEEEQEEESGAPAPVAAATSQPAAKACPKCGRQMPADAVFCPFCGAKLA
jgi:hypothetical protein